MVKYFKFGPPPRRYRHQLGLGHKSAMNALEDNSCTGILRDKSAFNALIDSASLDPLKDKSAIDNSSTDTLRGKLNHKLVQLFLDTYDSQDVPIRYLECLKRSEARQIASEVVRPQKDQ